MIKVNVKAVGVDLRTNNPVIILVNEEEQGMLLISIGEAEARAIVVALQDIELPRPISYDLLKTILYDLGARVDEVRITDLQDGTYFADILMTHNGQEMVFDSRPSDAIALALRTDTPIFISDRVAKKALVYDQSTIDVEEEREKFREFLDNVRPEDFGELDDLE